MVPNFRKREKTDVESVHSGANTKKVAVMQPYFFPYIGYFQLIAAVDQFILYDNIKYTKKGWINRNRILRDGEDVLLSLPLQQGSDFLTIKERRLATNFDREKMLRQVRSSYLHAPYFAETFHVIEQIVQYRETDLFDFLRNGIAMLSTHLSIGTEIMTSSRIPIDHTLRGEKRVLAFCGSVGARTYINAIGGLRLYSRQHFEAEGLDLRFLKSKPVIYEQFGDPFVPWLSIIDVMMFNPRANLQRLLSTEYELL